MGSRGDLVRNSLPTGGEVIDDFVSDTELKVNIAPRVTHTDGEAPDQVQGEDSIVQAGHSRGSLYQSLLRLGGEL
jgi:hypothetical protein